MSQEPMDQLRGLFDAVTPIPTAEWDYARQFIVLRSYDKGEHLLCAGQMAYHSFVILQGIVRAYYVTDSGKELNRGFAAEGEFAGSVSSIIGKLPSRFSIQALERTATALLPRAAIEEAYGRHRCWDRFGRIIAESGLICLEGRDSELLDSAEDRYLRLLTSYPELTRRVAQYHIASYLGITDVALSRLRRRLRQAGKLPQ